MDIKALRRERTAIYHIMPEDKARYFALIINLFYFKTPALSALTKKTPAEIQYLNFEARSGHAL